MSFKILLLNPITIKNEQIIRTGRCQVRTLPGIGLWPPINLAQIAAELQDLTCITDINILDAVLNGSFKDMIDSILNYKPDVLMINSSTPTVDDDKFLGKLLKEKLPNTLIIVFGLHALVRPEDYININEKIDCAILCEPEYVVKDICKAYFKDGISGIKKIPNLLLKLNEKKICYTAKNIKEVDLNTLKNPARELINNENYKLTFNNEIFTIIQPSRGCYNKCIFCTATIFSNKVRFRSVELIVKEIEEVIEKFNINNFMFLSDTFTSNRENIVKLCNEIIERKIKIKWIANTRVDKIDFELANLLKKAGCWLVSIGIESGSNEILKRIKKGINTDQVINAISILRQVKLKTIGYFMFGLPGETLETMKKTISFACKLPLDYAYFYIATPYPGTELFNEAVDNRWLNSFEWSNYFHGESNVLEYDHLSSDEISSYVKKAYKKFYFNPKRIKYYIADFYSPKIIWRYFISFINIFKIFKRLRKKIS